MTEQENKNENGSHAGEKRQATLDDVVQQDQPEQKKPKQADLKDIAKAEGGKDVQPAGDDEKNDKPQDEKSEANEKGGTTAPETTTNGSSGDAVAVDQERKKDEQNSPILEKGTIYFFFKPKVDLEKIDSAVDAQRSYIVLKPLPTGAKLEKGADLADTRTRFIELPKKQLPRTGEKFMAFVASPDSTPEDIKTRLGGSEYSTSTAGQRTQPAARPMGEGVYCLVSIQSATHLVYMLTLPKEPGEVQKEFGIDGNQGSFVLSTKNPKSKSGANQLPANADFSDDVQAEFGQRSWLPTTVAHLDHENAAFLMIGEKDEKAEQLDDEVKHALSTIEDEDARRVSLKKIFTELGLSTSDHEAKPLTEGKFA